MDVYIIDTVDFRITQFEFLVRLAIATGIGFLIGFEREHHALAKGSEAFAGIRTFIVLSLTGFVGTAMHFLLSPWVFISVLAAVIILTSVSYWITAQRGDIGGTSELSGILTVLLGALTFLGHFEISLAITVLLVLLLSLKFQMQEIVEAVSKDEMYDFIRFVVIALMIFPFLPDETYGPYDVFNPRELGWVIILVSGVGLAGFILMGAFGTRKGILLTGIIGGLASSTAVTWVFSKKSKEQPALSQQCITAILAASTVMIVRVGVWVTIFNAQLMKGLLPAMIAMLVASVGMTLWFYFREKNHDAGKTQISSGPPLNLTAAVVFALLYTAILFAVAYAHEQFGSKGIYIASGIAGLSDVDAITISVSKLSLGNLSMITAQNAILIATISNTLVKAGIAIWAGSKEMRKYVLLGYGAISVAAIIGFVIMNLI